MKKARATTFLLSLVPTVVNRSLLQQNSHETCIAFDLIGYRRRPAKLDPRIGDGNSPWLHAALALAIMCLTHLKFVAKGVWSKGEQDIDLVEAE